jgi:cholera toxin transcriptional activator
MPSPQPSPGGRIVRFGIFEVDLIAGELRKNGARVRLQEQPFQVLAVLLERCGDVVTREELRQKVWPADTFVDFDHSLNTAVNKIRDALGDSPVSPRYVETLARRGYRFIGPVQRDTRGKESRSISLPARETGQAPSLKGDDETGSLKGSEAAPAKSEEATAAVHPDLEVPIPHRGVTRGLFALIQLMYLTFYTAALFQLHEIDRIAESFLPGWGAFAIVVAVLVTAGVGIPLRSYLLSAVGFDYSRLEEKFRRLFAFVLLLDELWAVAPFLLVEKIRLGPAFAATAALLYVPFSERTLVRMAYARSIGRSGGRTSR